MLFDTHTHLNDAELYNDLDNVLARAEKAGVEKMAAVGYNWASSLMSVRLAEKYPQRIYAIVGIHPYDAKLWDNALSKRLSALASEPQVVAIGEIGLDYYRDISSPEEQKKAFISQIDLAKQLRKPIVIHNRETHGDMMKILRQEKAGLNGGVLHCFSGSVEIARECIKLGFHISLAGPVTFHNARNLHQVAKEIPLEHLLVETDCPYLSPHPYRGKTNEPARVALVVAKIAEIKNIDIKEVEQVTTANACKIFSIQS
ncbi:MAG: TatD family hydrolase [Bacillota bacterium]|jgi:TatD DNase family protein